MFIFGFGSKEMEKKKMSSQSNLWLVESGQQFLNCHPPAIFRFSRCDVIINQPIRGRIRLNLTPAI